MRLATGRHLAAVVMLSCAVGLSSGDVAAATERPLIASPAGWAWIATRSAAALPASLSGVPTADVAIAWSGQATKVAYVGVPAVAAGGSVALRVRSDPSYRSAVQADSAALQACLIVTPWEAARPMAWDTRPVTDCRTHALGTWIPASREYRFDVTPLVAPLEQGQPGYGLSIEPAESASTPFDAAFLPPSYEVRRPVALPSEVAGTETSADPPSLPPAGLATEAAPPIVSIAPLTGLPAPGQGQAPALARLPVNASSTSPSRTVDLSGVYALLALLAVLPAVAAALRPSQRQETT